MISDKRVNSPLSENYPITLVRQRENLLDRGKLYPIPLRDMMGISISKISFVQSPGVSILFFNNLMMVYLSQGMYVLTEITANLNLKAIF